MFYMLFFFISLHIYFGGFWSGRGCEFLLVIIICIMIIIIIIETLAGLY